MGHSAGEGEWQAMQMGQATPHVHRPAVAPSDRFGTRTSLDSRTKLGWVNFP